MKPIILILFIISIYRFANGQVDSSSVDTLIQNQQTTENDRLRAKKQKPERKFYGLSLNTKLGVYNVFSPHTGLMIGADAYLYDTRKTVYSLGYYYSTQFEGPQYSNQIDFAIGKFYHRKRFYTYAQAGIGYIWGDSRTNDSAEPSKYNSVSMPLKAGIRIMPLKRVRIGFDLYGNLNFNHVSFTPLITIGIGRLSIQ